MPTPAHRNRRNHPRAPLPGPVQLPRRARANVTRALLGELTRQRAALPAGTAATLEGIDAASPWLLAAGVPQAWLVAQSCGLVAEDLVVTDPDDGHSVTVHVNIMLAGSVDVRLRLSVHDPDLVPPTAPVTQRGPDVLRWWDYTVDEAWALPRGHRGEPVDCAIPFGLSDPTVAAVYRRLRDHGLSIRDATATAPRVAAGRP